MDALDVRALRCEHRLVQREQRRAQFVRAHHWTGSTNLAVATGRPSRQSCFMKTFAAIALAVALTSAACASAARTTPAGACSAASLSAKLPKQNLPAAVARVRARIAAAAVACDYAKLQKIALEKGNGFSSRSAPRSPPPRTGGSSSRSIGTSRSRAS